MYPSSKPMNVDLFDMNHTVTSAVKTAQAVCFEGWV